MSARHKWVPFEVGYRCERCLAKRLPIGRRWTQRRRFEYAVPGWGPLSGTYVRTPKMPACQEAA